MPSENKKQTLSGFEKEIHTRYYKKKGFPDIEGYLFISSVSGEGVEALRQKIYNVAESMNSGSNTLTGAPNRKMVYFSFYFTPSVQYPKPLRFNPLCLKSSISV